jgi:hypothetical protein
MNTSTQEQDVYTPENYVEMRKLYETVLESTRKPGNVIEIELPTTNGTKTILLIAIEKPLIVSNRSVAQPIIKRVLDYVDHEISNPTPHQESEGSQTEPPRKNTPRGNKNSHSGVNNPPSSNCESDARDLLNVGNKKRGTKAKDTTNSMPSPNTIPMDTQESPEKSPQKRGSTVPSQTTESRSVLINSPPMNSTGLSTISPMQNVTPVHQPPNSNNNNNNSDDGDHPQDPLITPSPIVSKRKNTPSRNKTPIEIPSDSNLRVETSPELPFPLVTTRRTKRTPVNTGTSSESPFSSPDPIGNPRHSDRLSDPINIERLPETLPQSTTMSPSIPITPMTDFPSMSDIAPISLETVSSVQELFETDNDLGLSDESVHSTDAPDQPINSPRGQKRTLSSDSVHPQTKRISAEPIPPRIRIPSNRKRTKIIPTSKPSTRYQTYKVDTYDDLIGALLKRLCPIDPTIAATLFSTANTLLSDIFNLSGSIPPETIKKCQQLTKSFEITQFIVDCVYGGLYTKYLEINNIEWGKQSSLDFLRTFDIPTRKASNLTNQVISYYIYQYAGGKFYLKSQEIENEIGGDDEEEYPIVYNGYSFQIVYEIYSAKHGVSMQNMVEDLKKKIIQE